MRNFVPLSLFAAAASLAVLNLPSHVDHLAVTANVPTIAPAAAGADWRVHSQPHEPATLQLLMPLCESHARCAVQRPMT
jgi:hypothetical protein